MPMSHRNRIKLCWKYFRSVSPAATAMQGFVITSGTSPPRSGLASSSKQRSRLASVNNASPAAQTPDATSNPHLALAAIATAGLLGLRRHGRLPAAVAADPATLSRERRQQDGIRALPSSLLAALDALAADQGVPHSVDSVHVVTADFDRVREAAATPRDIFYLNPRSDCCAITYI